MRRTEPMGQRGRWVRVKLKEPAITDFSVIRYRGTGQLLRHRRIGTSAFSIIGQWQIGESEGYRENNRVSTTEDLLHGE